MKDGRTALVHRQARLTLHRTREASPECICRIVQ
jgi:hypothetical protein